MLQKIFLKLKEKLSSSLCKNKLVFQLGLFLIFLFWGFILPSCSAQAFVPLLAEAIAEEIFTWSLKLLLWPAFLFLDFSIIVLRWVTDAFFMSWPYTSTNNPIIQVGWTLTRDLANMAFIIILAVIGLGTALRLKEYELQKTLLPLIGVALLINFTPVLTGLIVDASNIIMNFFLEGLTGFGAIGRAVGSNVASSIQHLEAGGVFGLMLSLPFVFLFIAIISIFMGMMILAFAAIFIVRHVAIWILVILSPFAFICYILPKTRGVFWTWWNQFFQWCIIGIVAAFFIYLANYLITEPPEFSSLPTTEWHAPFFMGFFTSIMPFIIAMILLCFGFFVALSSSAAGASIIISTVQRGAKAAGKTAGKQAWKKTTDAAKFIPKEVDRIKRTYDAHRKAFPTHTGAEALRSVMADYAQKAPKRAWEGTKAAPKKAWKGIKAAPKAQLKAVRDIGKAFYEEVVGKKKKERPTCSVCGNYVPGGAAHCPHCGATMPTCPKCGKKSVPGAKFCQSCGTLAP